MYILAGEACETRPGSCNTIKTSIKNTVLIQDRDQITFWARYIEMIPISRPNAAPKTGDELLKIDNAFGSLMPEDKVNKVQALKNENRAIAFVGDGVNDAPVIALADAGIAMGGLGSDATIETADIVIQNDMPSKIVTAIKIGKVTRKIVWQNITMAMVVKIIVLALGAGGVATLWEAVFADVGVALVAILNAVRIQNIKFH